MSQKKLVVRTLAVLLLLSLVVPAQAQDIHFLEAADGDLVATELVRLPAEKGLIPGVSRDAVDFSYAIDKNYAFNGDAAMTASQPFNASSREYFVDVDATELVNGVTIYTTAPGALLRINPVNKGTVVIDPSGATTTVDPAGASSPAQKAGGSYDPTGLVATGPGGVVFSAAEAFERIVSAEQLAEAGVPFADGTIAVRLSPAVGAGAITIAMPALKSDARYTVHVFDRLSPIALELGADRLDYLHGDQLNVRASFAGADVALGSVEGFITSPAGQAWPLNVAVENGALVGSLSLDAAGAVAPGLWEVHLAARGTADGLEVVRSVRTSFAAHLPTARLDGRVERVKMRDGLALRFGVEVGTPGRFEVRGVLYGTDASGQLAPMAIGHVADWLDASGALTLSFPSVEGFRGPYELRDLRLLDQSRMGVLHRQDRALQLRR